MRLNEKIHITSHNTNWKQDYIEEIERFRKNTVLSELNFEHIGSTAIQNIKAKPIIDIIIGVDNFPVEDYIIKAVMECGYIYMQEMSVADRLYFIKRGSKCYNVHIVMYKGDVWEKNVLFRDYMINNPDKAQEYSELKEQIYDSGIDTLLEYSKEKAEFIADVFKDIYTRITDVI